MNAPFTSSSRGSSTPAFGSACAARPALLRPFAVIVGSNVSSRASRRARSSAPISAACWRADSRAEPPTSRHGNFTRRYLDEVLGWTLAAVGFYFQYTQMFSPPFVVELLLWPLQTIEYGLLYAVASTSAPAAA